VTGAWR